MVPPGEGHRLHDSWLRKISTSHKHINANATEHLVSECNKEEHLPLRESHVLLCIHAPLRLCVHAFMRGLFSCSPQEKHF
jgi:hypothetical protein